MPRASEHYALQTFSSFRDAEIQHRLLLSSFDVSLSLLFY